MSLCACGCGSVTTVYTKTKTAFGVKRGQPAQFCAGHNRRRASPARFGARIQAVGYIGSFDSIQGAAAAASAARAKAYEGMAPHV